MQTLVALDLETTGLDPQRDAIIEIGAVKFRGHRVEAEWSSLVNPGRPLTPFITDLTGITDDMLANAPRITSVQNEFAEFVGDLPILGHRVEFDHGFLAARGLFDDNPLLDTFDLASVVLPSASRYSLIALANELGIPVQVSHRAFEDAQTTRQLFLKLYEAVSALPLNLVQTIANLSQTVDWGASWIFESALDDQIEAGEEIPVDAVPMRVSFPLAEIEGSELKPIETPQKLDVEELASVLEPGGAFTGIFSQYEHRSQQVRMLIAVAEALSEHKHLLVEAGTGTGKTLAYLIPALAWAQSNGERVLVSTNTINLQDQLIYKDIPDLRQALGEEYSASVLKGRGNYLCPKRMNALLSLGPKSAEEMRLLAKILVWLHADGTGDVSEINLGGPAESILWGRLSSDSEDCDRVSCMQATGGTCPYFQARDQADGSHVVIVNHALLLADIATGSRVLPDYQYLIVDEAHHFESATTRGLSFRASQFDISRTLNEIGNRSSGPLVRSQRLLQKAMGKSAEAEIAERIDGIVDKAKASTGLAANLFQSLAAFMEFQRDGAPVGGYGQQLRIMPSSRTLPQWSDVEVAWEHLRNSLTGILDGMATVAESVASLAESGDEIAGDLSVAIRSIHRELSEYLRQLDELIFEADPQKIYWLSLPADQTRLMFHSAPLAVGPLVEKHIWHQKEAVIMTSATMTTAGSFDYLRARLAAVDADELFLDSPFDYESATLLYLVNDIAEPHQRSEYQRGIERGLTALAKAIGGRTLALFTSNEQLRRTAAAIFPALNSNGILVLEQSRGVSRHALLDSFRTAESAILLGTRSFWEGVDVPGEALSALALVRLPFDVPSDPVIAARAETYDSPFSEYSLPEAILRFRQGFGRLIRTRSDRGVVVTFDRRLLTKSYGRSFIDSLPRCTVQTGPLDKLASEASRWLGV
jgi:DNA polymerase-3 subunit epsilon/ATP-dependent DNA helicase DinG